MDVRPGRPDLNLNRMLQFIAQARQANAEIIVFSELCLSGYLIGDLWEIDTLVNDFADYSNTIRQASEGLTIIFGNVAIDPEHIGQDGRQRKYNAIYVCSNGQYVQRPALPPGLQTGIQPKTLHPNYRFFDDDRHFFSLRQLAQEQGRSVYDWSVPFQIIRRDGTPFTFGVQLCEDIWCQDYTYDNDPLNTLHIYHQRGVDAVFNLSASPWTWKKNDKRNRVVRDILSRSPLPFFYINQVGAQNNGKNTIVFDGDTTVYAPDGEILQRATPWHEELVLTHVARPLVPPQDETTAVYDAVRTGIKHLDHIRGEENSFLIGVSGGIDSSVNACLLAQTIGPERIFAINTPTRFNADITQNNARLLCKQLGIDYISCPIQQLYETVAQKIKNTHFATGPGTYTRLVDENIQARIRGADILSGLAAKYGLIYTNNGNKTETALGYATLYGDINGAVAPIADLYKVQVLELAHYLNTQVFGRDIIPANLLSGKTVPSAELSAAQDVTKGLGDPIKYGYHDAILRQLIEHRRHPLDILQWQLDGILFDQLNWTDRDRFYHYFPTSSSWVEDLEWLDHQLRINYFKRIQAPPIIVLSKRAFGFDLRETQWPAYIPRRYAAVKQDVLNMPFNTITH